MKDKSLTSKVKMIAGIATAACVAYKAYKVFSRPAKLKKLKDQVVVITGASEGIGKAYADDFAKAGAKLVLAARRKEKLEETAKELKEKYNIETLAVVTDVSKEHDCINLIEQALEHFGHVDILINNAGTATYEFFHKENVDNLKRIMDINYWGMVYCTHAVLPSMISRGSGKIINISSVAGKIGTPAMANYAATKHAMNGFSDALRAEVAKYGIQVNVICPTSTKTSIVMNSANNSAVKFDPKNYPGMTPERVSKETMNAILDNKPEHVIGFLENIGIAINKISPATVNNTLKHTIRFIFKD